MKKELRAKERIVTDNGQKMELQYYLTEKRRSDRSLFGIAIEKTDDGKCDEAVSLLGISYERQEVEGILNRLIQGRVTPYTMLETIDAILTG